MFDLFPQHSHPSFFMFLARVSVYEEVITIEATACPLLTARVVIRLSHRLHKGCNFFWSLSREKTGGKRGEGGEDHSLIPLSVSLCLSHFTEFPSAAAGATEGRAGGAGTSQAGET